MSECTHQGSFTIVSHDVVASGALCRTITIYCSRCEKIVLYRDVQLPPKPHHVVLNFFPGEPTLPARPT